MSGQQPPELSPAEVRAIVAQAWAHDPRHGDRRLPQPVGARASTRYAGRYGRGRATRKVKA